MPTDNRRIAAPDGTLDPQAFVVPDEKNRKKLFEVGPWHALAATRKRSSWLLRMRLVHVNITTVNITTCEECYFNIIILIILFEDRLPTRCFFLARHSIM
jgi:hypothetical protein